MNNTENKVNVSFAAIDPWEERNIPLPTEKKMRGKDMVTWGDDNRYPEYLISLYEEVSDLKSIIDGTADFITGDDVISNRSMNTKGESAFYIVHELALDLLRFGGFAIQVIRDKKGNPVEIYHLPMRYLRTDKENEVFYYSEKWGKTTEVLVYPKYMKIENWDELTDEQKNRHASSVIFYKSSSIHTYPLPVWSAAVKSCEIQRGIDDFHLNALDNGFTPSALVNFNNGVPTDEQKEEIEDGFYEKYLGHKNAGRAMFSYNKSKDSATTIDFPKTEDFGERYNALDKSSRQKIYCAFRAVPALFGLMNETSGFAEQEFSEAFKLYNRTAVKPRQRVIIDTINRVFPDSITIRPFSLEGGEQNVD